MTSWQVIPNNANPLQIGGNSSQSFWFPGVIDEVRLYHTALSVADVQNLYNNPAAIAPALAITVLRDASSIVGAGTPASGATVTLHWNAEQGKTYRVQYKDTLADLDWKDLGNSIVADGPGVTFRDAASAGQRFYRVVEDR